MAGKRSSGEGQLRQRPNGLWELTLMIGYHEDGRRKLKSFYGKTQKEVKEKSAEYRKKVDAGLSTDKDMTFSSWADTWYSGYKDSVSPTTYEGYRYTLAALKDAFGSRKLQQIKPLDIENFLKGLRSSGKSDSYITKCRGMMFQILHKAEANDLILKNPVRYADKMKRTGSKQSKDAFTKDEIALLNERLPTNRIGYSIRLMIATGMRGQEIVALEPHHIEPDGSFIYIRQAVKMLKGKPYIGDTKSTKSERDIPVPEPSRYAARYLRDNAGVFIWDGKKAGRPFNLRNFRDKFVNAVEAIEGVRPLTPHCCRHTYITRMQALGVDMETIKALAGHSDTDMTEHYVHVQKEALIKAAELLASELAPVKPHEMDKKEGDDIDRLDP